jgi:hypothetical protein
MTDAELQHLNSNVTRIKRRHRPLIGYLIAGILGWMLLVTVLVFLSPEFLDDGETAGQTIGFLVLGFLLGGSLYHILWGRPIRFGLRSMLVGVVVVAVLCAFALYWEYLPGTLHFDENGFPHGTGTKLYYYDSGELMGEEHYRAGVLTRTTWYKPNGEAIATTIWKKDQVNIGYFLYQDGSIRTKMEFVYDPEVRLYVDSETGDRIDYAPDGTVEREFHNGKQIPAATSGMVESKDAAPARRNRNTDQH